MIITSHTIWEPNRIQSLLWERVDYVGAFHIGKEGLVLKGMELYLSNEEKKGEF